MSIRAKARKVRARKRAFDDAVKDGAWYFGWVGMALLALCGLLWLIPGWDGTAGLKADRLPIYTLVAMMMASLVGWLYVNKGEDRLKARFGQALSIILFVGLPVACMGAELVDTWLADQTGWQPPNHPFWLFVHWYPALLVIVCAAVFLSWKAKPRKHLYLERGFGYGLLFVPYGLLFAYLVLGARMDWVGQSMNETLSSLGRYSLVLQLVIAYFIGGD